MTMFDDTSSLEESLLLPGATRFKDVPRRGPASSEGAPRSESGHFSRDPYELVLAVDAAAARLTEALRAALRAVRASPLEDQFDSTNPYAPLWSDESVEMAVARFVATARAYAPLWSDKSFEESYIASLASSPGSPRPRLPTAGELEQLRRQGALARPEPDRPRGSFDAPAVRRPGIADLGIHVEVLHSEEDERVRAAAAEVLGEWGGPEEIAALSDVLRGPAPVRVRSAAAAALANIGGPGATRLLRETMSTDAAPLAVRGAALVGLLDHVTGGWENYRMTGARVVLPAWLRRDLELLRSSPDLASDLTAILSMFD